MPVNRSRNSESSPPKRPPELHLLRSALNYLTTERGLADNSIQAYRRDLEDTNRWLETRGKTLATAQADDFRAYLQDQTRRGQSTPTVTRRLAAIRVFLRYLVTMGVDTTAILAQLERPKPQRSLPKIMGRAQVMQLINAPDPGYRFFSRDVAILELLYASGLRASELCGLKLSNLNMDVRCLRVLGKGAKERIIPFGRAAAEAMTHYLTESRPRLLRAPSELVFLSRMPATAVY
jgi:integrase/recombinase XerD